VQPTTPLIDTDAVDNTFTFDPSGLSPGFYALRLTVNDGSATDEAEITLNILNTAPVLTTADSDGDGTDDQTEGYGDSDGDGIPEYLDAISSTNVLQSETGQSMRYLLETEAGLSLNLGNIAFQAGNGQSEVSMTDITNAGSTNDDPLYEYLGGLFDFTISELPVAGQSVNVVLPQLTQVPENAVYRTLLVGGWQDFALDANNVIASAPGEEGYCPLPGDVAYQSGLTEGHWCVQLTIEDGGANDADSTANNSVADSGGVTQALSVRKHGDGWFGIGSFNPLLLILFGLFGFHRVLFGNRKKKKRQHR